MNFRIIATVLITSFLGLIVNQSNAQDKNHSTMAKLFQNSTLSGQYFMSYDYNSQDDLTRFQLKRGYFTIKTKMSDVFSVRYTQDITLDTEGSDAGNVEIRLKYLYLKTKLDCVPFLKNTYIEAGVVHRPWLDFEQHINQYRVQGKMFIERQKLVSSADFGIVYMGLLGGKIDEEYRKEVNSKEAGKYGSFALGLFNGGGYHAVEMNNNKIFESRLTIRPLPQWVPGLQFSHGFSYGASNNEEGLPYRMHVGMISSESRFHTLTAQYYSGYGNVSGIYYASEDYVSDIFLENDPFESEGFSFFGEIKSPKTGFALFGRYDSFTLHKNEDEIKETIIIGGSYRFLKNKVILDYQNEKLADGSHIDYFEVALEIAF
jgi:hypothetical protein